MDPLALSALLLAALATLWLMRQKSRGSDSAPAKASKPRDAGRPGRSLEALDTVIAWPPEVTRILTHTERKAHGLLVQSLPEHMVLAQVPLSRFIKVPTRNSYQEWMSRVGQLCADLVVCDAASQVQAVVEVRRPPGKDTERTLKRHQRMDRILRKAGIRVIVWNEEALPRLDEVRDKVLGVSQDLSSAEGGQAVATRAAGAAGAPARAPVQMPHPAAVATLHEAIGMEVEEIEAAPMLAEPAPSTWFDNLDSLPAPLGDPLKR